MPFVCIHIQFHFCHTNQHTICQRKEVALIQSQFCKMCLTPPIPLQFPLSLVLRARLSISFWFLTRVFSFFVVFSIAYSNAIFMHHRKLNKRQQNVWNLLSWATEQLPFQLKALIASSTFQWRSLQSIVGACMVCVCVGIFCWRLMNSIVRWKWLFCG